MMFATEKVYAKLVGCAAGIMLCSVGHAQTNVTLYGVVDGGFLYTSKTADSTGRNAGHQFSAIDSGLSSSQFGMQGSEDLGGGLKALFKLESGINIMNGGYNDTNGNFFGRQAYVAVAGPYGQTTFGLQYSPFLLALYSTDPRNFSEFASILTVYLDNVLDTGLFNSNAISYTTPSFYGFQGSAMLALGGHAEDFRAGRQYSASLKFDNGTFQLDAAIYSGNSAKTELTPIPSTIEFWGRMIGASYKFGSVIVKAQFANFKVAQSFNANVYTGGLDYYVTPELDLNGGFYYTSDRNHTENHSILGAIGATYFMSKRTSFYAQLGVVNNHGAMNTGLSVSNALYGTQGATTVGADFGIRHSF